MADAETSENKNIENTPENGDNACDSSQIPALDTSEEKPREITQTDHLNKRLLSAFLDKINTEVSDNNISEDSEDPWEEQPGH
ncbi:hypothetical protein ACF0H5_013467 [Mactra antiquata]